MVARTNEQTLRAVRFVTDEKKGVVEAAKKAGVHRTTLWRALKRYEKQQQNEVQPPTEGEKK